MNEEIRNATETNPYVPNTSAMTIGTWIPDICGLTIKLTVLLVSLFLIGMYLLGLPPAANSLDFVEEIPLTEAVEAAVNADWAAYLRSRSTYQLFFDLWFLPVCLIGLIGYLAAPRRSLGIALSFHGSVVGLVLLFLLMTNPLLLLAILILPMTLLGCVFGRVDGEGWQDAARFSVISTWVLMWMILLGMAWRRNRILRRARAIEGTVETV